jgi:hypothetical protein
MRLLPILLVAAVLIAVGCNETKPTADRDRNPAASGDDAKIKASLDKLSPEDRALAEAQKTCPVTGEPLGSMGVPIKVMVKDQPVFVCCSSCPKEATKDPDKTLQKVAELKEKNAKKDR